MAQTFMHLLIHVTFLRQGFPTPLRGLACCWYAYPGLTALGYFPMPLRGAKINDAASPTRCIA